MELRGRRRPHRALHIIALAFLCGSALVAGPASAQQIPLPPAQAETGILVVNQERLFGQSQFGRRIQAELEAASARLAAENRRIEAQLTSEELALTEARDTLPPDEFRAQADAFDTRVEAIRSEQDTKARQLNAQAEAAQSTFFEEVAPILLDIVQARGASVLMDSRAVLLSAERVDITEDAIAEIDAVLGDGGPDPLITVMPAIEPVDAEAPAAGEDSEAAEEEEEAAGPP